MESGNSPFFEDSSKMNYSMVAMFLMKITYQSKVHHPKMSPQRNQPQFNLQLNYQYGWFNSRGTRGILTEQYCWRFLNTTGIYISTVASYWWCWNINQNKVLLHITGWVQTIWFIWKWGVIINIWDRTTRTMLDPMRTNRSTIPNHLFKVQWQTSLMNGSWCITADGIHRGVSNAWGETTQDGTASSNIDMHQPYTTIPTHRPPPPVGENVPWELTTTLEHYFHLSGDYHLNSISVMGSIRVAAGF